MNPSQLSLLNSFDDNIVSRLFAVHLVGSDDSTELVLKFRVKNRIVIIRQAIDHRDALLLELADN